MGSQYLRIRKSVISLNSVVHRKAQFIGVVFRVKPTIMTKLCERKLFVKNKNENKNKNKNRNNQRFCQFQFGTLPMSLTPSDGSGSFDIGRRPQKSPYKFESFRFGQYISVRSVLYLIGWPFCFRGSSNINVLLTLIIICKLYCIKLH